MTYSALTSMPRPPWLTDERERIPFSCQAIRPTGTGVAGFDAQAMIKRAITVQSEAPHVPFFGKPPEVAQSY